MDLTIMLYRRTAYALYNMFEAYVLFLDEGKDTIPRMNYNSTASMRVSPKEACGILGAYGYKLTTKTIREWCKDRKFVGAHKLQGRWHIPEREVRQLIKSCS